MCASRAGDKRALVGMGVGAHGAGSVQGVFKIRANWKSEQVLAVSQRSQGFLPVEFPDGRVERAGVNPSKPPYLN